MQKISLQCQGDDIVEKKQIKQTIMKRIKNEIEG